MHRLLRPALGLALSAAVILAIAAAPLPSFVQAADSRLDDAIAEITLLKRVVAEQDKRITALEQAVASLNKGAVGAAYSRSPDATPPVQPSGAQWKTAANWDRIRSNMSEAQVIAILGRPTSTKDIAFRTLFYEGDVPGSGTVSGNVKFHDGQVLTVNKPVF